MRAVRSISFLRLVAGLLVGFALTGGPAYGQSKDGSVIYVDADATGGKTGTSWTDAYTDLQDALAAAKAGDEIWVAEGIYTPTNGTDRMVSFVLTSGVALYGGFNGTEQTRAERDWVANETVLSGEIGDSEDEDDNAYHVVTAIDTNVGTIIDGFTVEKGWGGEAPHDRGGGLLALQVNLTIRNVVLRSNGAYRGGGMYLDGGTTLVEDVLFEGNVGIGGGLYVTEADPILRQVTFRDNSFAGLYFEGGAAGLIEDALFEGNRVGAYVSGVGTAPVFRRVTFRGNESPSGDGGGVSIRDGAAPLFEDCLFEHNRAYFNGGGAFVEAAAPVFLRTTFRQNFAGGSGGSGAFIKDYSDALFLGCTFVRNRSTHNGALTVVFAAGAVVNTTFYGNHSFDSGTGGLSVVAPLVGSSVLVANAALVGNRGAEGGALAVGLTAGTDVRVVNVVAAANEATGAGGAVWARDAEGTRIENALFWGNAAPGGEEIAVSQGEGPLVRRSLVEGGYAEGTDILDADPLFVRMPDPGADGQWGTEDDDYGDLRLLEGSPAVDYALAEYLPPDVWDLDGDGDTEEPLPVDLAGNPRVLGEAPDLGAYEGAVRVANEPPVSTQAASLLLHPNPVTGTAITATLTHGTAGRVTAALYDVLGRQVSSTDYGVFQAGSHALEVDVRGLARGTYLLRVTVEPDSGTARALVRTVTLL